MDYAQLLSQLASTQNGSIVRHQLANGEYVWVRRASRRHAMYRYRLLGFVSRLFGLPLLSPVPNLGGEQGIATEAMRLTQLNQAGIMVPRLLAQQADALMMSDISAPTLESQIRHSPPTEAMHWFLQGIDAIQAVHEQGQYLSQAFARNIIAGEHIAFIDFEDDPASVLNLLHCQARDWFCYLLSTADLLKQKGKLNDARQFWQGFETKLPQSMVDEMHKTVRRLRWLRHFNHKKLGADTIRLISLIVMLDPDSTS